MSEQVVSVEFLTEFSQFQLLRQRGEHHIQYSHNTATLGRKKGGVSVDLWLVSLLSDHPI